VDRPLTCFAGRALLVAMRNPPPLRMVELVGPSENVTPITRIRCAQCGARPSGEVVGWEPYLSGGYEGEPVELGVFCPVCAVREIADVV